MDKNSLIDLITKLSQAAVNAPPKQSETNQPKSFKEQTAPKVDDSPQKAQVEKINRAKRPVPSTDAIIQTIRAHNALSQQIAQQNVQQNADKNSE